MTDRRFIFAALAGLVLLAGCMAVRPQPVSPDEQFGHRIDGTDEQGRETLVIVPPDDGRSYSTWPAVYETVTIRAEPFAPGVSSVSVEVLIKGAFPDGCTDLNAVTQQRSGHLVESYLEMRRPRGAVCATVLRPYRYYMMLEGKYEPGAYTLTLNGRAHPFEVRGPGGGS